MKVEQNWLALLLMFGAVRLWRYGQSDWQTVWSVSGIEIFVSDSLGDAAASGPLVMIFVGALASTAPSPIICGNAATPGMT